MRNYQTVAQPTRTITSTQCDNCHRVERGEDPPGWFRFGSGHSDWGNDSIESHENWDVCSGACFLSLLDRIDGDYGRELKESTLRIWCNSFDQEFLKSLLAAGGTP